MANSHKIELVFALRLALPQCLVGDGGGGHPWDASRGKRVALALRMLKTKVMGLIFVGPILASSALPLLSRPSFVLRENAGEFL